MEALRRCPLAIAQRLVHCAIALSTAVLDRVTKTMSAAPLLMNNLDNSKQKTSNLLSPAPPPYSWSLLGKSEGPAPPPSSKISWSSDLAWNPLTTPPLFFNTGWVPLLLSLQLLPHVHHTCTHTDEQQRRCTHTHTRTHPPNTHKHTDEHQRDVVRLGSPWWSSWCPWWTHWRGRRAWWRKAGPWAGGSGTWRGSVPAWARSSRGRPPCRSRTSASSGTSPAPWRAGPAWPSTPSRSPGPRSPAPRSGSPRCGGCLCGRPRRSPRRGGTGRRGTCPFRCRRSWWRPLSSPAPSAWSCPWPRGTFSASWAGGRWKSRGACPPWRARWRLCGWRRRDDVCGGGGGPAWSESCRSGWRMGSRASCWRPRWTPFGRRRAAAAGEGHRTRRCSRSFWTRWRTSAIPAIRFARRSAWFCLSWRSWWHGTVRRFRRVLEPRGQALPVLRKSTPVHCCFFCMNYFGRLSATRIDLNWILRLLLGAGKKLR